MDIFLYNVETPLKAIEVTFKVFHALHTLYTSDAEQLWLLIQQGLFNIKTIYEEQFLSVGLILPHVEELNVD